MADDSPHLTITTPLGDRLRVTSFSGTEALSSLFSFIVELESDEPVEFDEVVGNAVTVSLEMRGGTRHVNGIVSRFSAAGAGATTAYFAEVVPWLWLLTRQADCRIFQNISVPDIVRQIFGKYTPSDFSIQLRGSYEPREYCVQYRETDFNFVSRLLEEEGIFYFFTHDEGKHTLVLGDTPQAHRESPVVSSLRYVQTMGSPFDVDVVEQFRTELQIRTGRHAGTDYNMTQPSVDMMAKAHGTDPRPFEIYDFPGFVDENAKTEPLARFVQLRQQEENAQTTLCVGRSFCRGLTAGHTFELASDPPDHSNKRFNGEYLVTSVAHSASVTFESGGSASFSYQNDFQCIPLSMPYRPPRRTPTPTIVGVQTAVVVGPVGEEIHVDGHGRVKVQFHWDRLGVRNENSSCWIRVSQAWAGKNWGFVAIPRIGHEVIVSFMEGDPDRPIITGRVYNGENMPPYALPENGTQTGLKTRSSKGGEQNHFNELRFEDKKGSEEVYLHAERNEKIVVEVDKSETIGHDETIVVHHDRTETVDYNEHLAVGKNRERTVGENERVSVRWNRWRTVGKNESVKVDGSQSVTVGGSQTISVGGDRTVTVKGNESITIEKDQSIAITNDRGTSIGGSDATEVAEDYDLNAGGKVTIEAGDELALICGSAQIVLKKSGDIVISGTDISVKGSGDVTVKGSKISLN